MGRRLRTLRLWAPVILYMSLIFYLSSRRRIPMLQWASDPFLHVAGYFVLGVLSVRAFGGGLPLLRPGARPFLSAVLLASLYGIGDEWHQSFVPGRTASGWDVLADVFGALCGAAGVTLLARRAPSPARPAEAFGGTHGRKGAGETGLT